MDQKHDSIKQETTTEETGKNEPGFEIVEETNADNHARVVSMLSLELWNASVETMTLDEMSNRTHFERESLKHFMVEDFGDWLDLEAVGFDEDEEIFFKRPGWIWSIGTISSVTDRVKIENDRGDRVECCTTLDVCENLLPGDKVLVVEYKKNPEEVWIAAIFSQPARHIVCGIHAFDLRRKRIDTVFASNPNFWMARIELDEPWMMPEGIRTLSFDVELNPRPVGYIDPPSGRICKVFQNADNLTGEIDVALAKYDIPQFFDESVIQEVQALPAMPTDVGALERKDLRDIEFVTIDGEDARDFDDAVWCTPIEDGWRLIVAIADVSSYVSEGSALDREALKRATSIYFPNRVIPMLPERLSTDLCSLKPGVDRAALVCDMQVGLDGIVTGYRFYPALIRSRARLTYKAVWAALQGETKELVANGGDVKEVRCLYELYKAFSAARKVRGAIDFQATDTQLDFDDQGFVKAIHRAQRNDAHRIIEECMLAANVSAADFIERHWAISLYRIHEAPTADKLKVLRAILSSLGCSLGGEEKPSAYDFEQVLDALKATPTYELVQAAMLRSMQRAVYSPDNCGHYGLNYQAYVHFTSPIRRYPDLLVHRTIRAILEHRDYEPALTGNFEAWLDGSNARRLKREMQLRLKKQGNQTHPVQSLENFRKLGLICSAAERRADDVTREVENRLKCRYINKFSGQTLEGTVSGVIASGIFVMLDDPKVEGFIHVSKIGFDYYDFYESSNTLCGRNSGEKFCVGRRVTATVRPVDAEQMRVEFTLPEENERDFEFSPKYRMRNFDWRDDWDDFDDDWDEDDFDEFVPKKRKKSKKKKKVKKSQESSEN